MTTTYIVQRPQSNQAPRLRTRLLLSYLLLLAISFVVLAFTSLLFLSSRPSPPTLTYQRLEVMLPALSNIPQVRDLLQAPGRATGALDTFAETNNVRLLLLRTRDNEMTIIHDSAGEFDPQVAVSLELDPSYNSRIRLLNNNVEILFGGFQDESDEWLFAGTMVRVDRNRRVPVDSLMVLLAEERPNESVQSVLAEFGSSFLLPLIQAMIFGGLVALILAVLISRSIARPLQALAKAATSVAGGHYDETVTETGPREVRAVATAFNRMSAEVRATQQSQREFMANVSHDLKTPLTSIQGYSQAIIDGAAKNPANAAQIIHDEAERLNRMVTELTDLARLQAGRLSMKMSGLDIGAIVAAIGERLSVVAENKAIELNVKSDPLPPIAGDGDRLVQVFTNLISNSIKYTPNGGKIWVTTGLRDTGVEVVVRDNGMGIPLADLPHIFDRFYQVDKARGPARGTGLGLAITQEIVQAHGGTIKITSPGVNRGTTVTVWLPSPAMTTIIRRR